MLSRGQQPFHCLPPVAYDGMPVIVQAVVAQNADAVVAGAVQTTVLLSLGAAALIGTARVLWRSTAARC